MDKKKLELEVVPQISGRMALPGYGKEKIIVQLTGLNKLQEEDGFFSGSTLRFWGKIKAGSKYIFVATDIRGCREGGCKDPTGVRSRLLKANRQGKSTYTVEMISDTTGLENERGQGGPGRGTSGNNDGNGGSGAGGGGNGGGNGGGEGGDGGGGGGGGGGGK